MLKGLFKGLARTKDSLVSKIRGVFHSRKIDAKVLEELEEIMLSSDIGVGTTGKLLAHMEQESKSAGPEIDPVDILKSAIVDVLASGSADSKGFEDNVAAGPRPYVALVVGVNGVGKTTTIAKLASLMKKEGKKVMVVAADTFRAAAVEQLSIWAERVGVEIVKGQTGSDPSAVIFDSLKAGQARGVDLIIVDTAGRLHTKYNLMEELKKMKRVAEKAYPGAPHEVIMVLDVTIGQNAISQARIFNDAIDLTGLVLAKVDSSSKGGVVLPIVDELKIPVYYLGVGEGDDDLIRFDAKEYVEELFR